MAEQILDVALTVCRALEAHGVPYTVGGSLASSFSGEPRFTQDVDILVALELRHVDALVASLGSAFYVDPDGLRRAIASRSSANLIHLPTNIKVDVFVAGGSVLDDLQLRRRQRRRVGTDETASVFFHSHEDILLQKLSWFRTGGEVSDRQWRDALAIVLRQRDRLDQRYLRETAAIAGLLDLLERVLDEAA